MIVISKCFVYQHKLVLLKVRRLLHKFIINESINLPPWAPSYRYLAITISKNHQNTLRYSSGTNPSHNARATRAGRINFIGFARRCCCCCFVDDKALCISILKRSRDHNIATRSTCRSTWTSRDCQLKKRKLSQLDRISNNFTQKFN